jgi:hypothetical protein
MPEPLVKTMKLGRNVAPVVESTKLPAMTEAAPRPRLIGGKQLLMAAEPKPDAGKQGRMAVVPAAIKQPPRPTLRKELPPMEPPKAAGGETATGGGKEGYVRLQLRVAGDRVTIVGARAVEGPYVPRETIHGALAYDVTVGDRRLAVGSIADAGERRSFPNEDPKAPPEQRGHHISEVPVYEVSVRVPASELSLAALPKLNVRLYRIKEEVDVVPPGKGPLGVQLHRELREVARVGGLELTTLDKPHQEELRRALR